MNAWDPVVAKAIELATDIVFTGLGILAMAFLNQLKGQIKNEKAKKAFETAESVASTVVKELEQTLVTSIKEASADGKLTADEIADIQEKAIDRFIEVAPNETYKALNENYDDIVVVIGALIESAVVAQKKVG